MVTRRGFSLTELIVSISMFAVLSLVMFSTLQFVTRIYQRTTSRDDAVGQLLKAKARLVADLMNSSQRLNQFAVQKVTPTYGAGAGFDGDALSFLSSDAGDRLHTWSTDTGTGEMAPAAQITWWLAVPQGAPRYGFTVVPGAPDVRGYEQRNPCKWLVRRVDPPIPGNPPVLDPNWTTWLTRPTTLVASSSQRVVADQLLSFRVLRAAPLWTIELTAVAIGDAMRETAVGQVPLSESRYTLVQQFSVPCGN